MARTKAISVKIATSKVIKALENALDKLDKQYASQADNEAKYEKAKQKWAKDVAKLAMTQIAKATDVSANTRYDGRVNVDFYLPAGAIEVPAEPKKDFDTLHEWQYREQKEEITNAIRILKMTDEEVVSTSTYQAVSRYL